jgi:hypothetical protein
MYTPVCPPRVFQNHFKFHTKLTEHSHNSLDILFSLGDMGSMPNRVLCGFLQFSKKHVCPRMSVTPLILKPRVPCAPELSKFRKTDFIMEFIRSEIELQSSRNPFLCCRCWKKSQDLVKVWVPYSFNWQFRSVCCNTLSYVA